MAEYPFKDLLPLDEVLEREGYYNDWTHLDPEVFYSLTQISEYIKTKGYGVDVRLLISQLAEHFGLRVTQITDAMNEFNDLKPKAELSVSQSAEALTKSQNALNVANGIDAKATNALSLSESADTLSKSVQEQFNQVVIDGDSSVEAAQARVDASGQTNPTLKARLDKEHNEVTAQLAQIETQKLNKGEVSVTDIDKNKGLIDETYLSDTLKQQIVGDAPIHAIPADDSLTTDKYVDESVTAVKMDNTAAAKALFQDWTFNTITSREVTQFDGSTTTLTGKTFDDEFEVKNVLLTSLFYSVWDLKLGKKYNFVFKTNFYDKSKATWFKLRKQVSGSYVTERDSVYLGDGLFAILDYIPLNENETYQLYVGSPSQANFTLYKTYITEDAYPVNDTFTRNVQKIVEENQKVIDERIFYVSPNGSDNNNDGRSSDSPLETFNKAIDLGARTIYAKPGDYVGQTLFADGLESLTIKLDTEHVEFDYNKPDKGVIRLVNANDLALTFDGTTGLYKAPLTVKNDSRFYKVFIDKSLSTINVHPLGNAYNATIWEITDSIQNDIKLKPVLTLNECQTTETSFFYDGSNVYVHPTGNTITDKSFKNPINDWDSVLLLQNIKKLVLEDIDVLYSCQRNGLDNIQEMTIRNVNVGYTTLSSGWFIQNSNGNFYRCSSFKNRLDGFGIARYGDTHFYDCEAYYNYDDGISHHDGCTGSITGGEYHHNGKGGVSPAHGCAIDVYNVLSHDNYYGMYASSDSPAPFGRTVRHVNNAYYNNHIGIRVSNYHVLSFNCKYENNDYRTDIAASEDTSFTEL